MRFRIKKVFPIEKSTLRCAKQFVEATAYQKEFCAPDSRNRVIEVIFETRGAVDVESRASFKHLIEYIRDYLSMYSGTICVNKHDRRLPEFRHDYTRLIVLDGEPTAALVAQTVLARVDAMLREEPYANLDACLRVAAVRVQEDDDEFAECVAD